MNKFIKNSLLTFIVMSVLLIGCSAQAANYPLEIIQPQPNLTTANRFYKAYPGLQYKVRVGVIGGAYPYIYSLTTYPAGMTINSSTGVITWSNPVTGDSPYSVTVSVTDMESTTVTRSWTITVTTSGFRFIDAVNGKSVADGGTGTIGNPWKTMADMYEGNNYNAKYANSYQGEFIYWRQGTYTLNGFRDANSGRVAFVSNYKPVVWLAYPGEVPTFDYVNDVYRIYFGGANSDIYLDGLYFINMGTCSYGLELDCNQHRMVFRNLNFHGLGNTPGSNNQSFIRLLLQGDNYGDYMTVQDSVFDTLDHGCGIKIYGTNKMLIEDNNFTNFIDSSEGGGQVGGIHLKMDTTRATIRHNTFSNIDSQAIAGSNYTCLNFEICFNYAHDPGSSSKTVMEFNNDGNAGEAFFYRNTLRGRVEAIRVSSSTGPFHLYNNVIINTDTGDHIWRFVDDITWDESKIIVTDNLTGVEADGILDSSGNLTSGYVQYLGSRGWQLGSARGAPPPQPGSAPSSPKGLRIE